MRGLYHERQTRISKPAIYVLSVIVVVAFLIRLNYAFDLPNEYSLLTGDQVAYAAHAGAFSEILSLLFDGQIPTVELFGQVYDGGTRPPLYPVVLGFGIWAFGDSVLTMRIITVVMGVLVVILAFVVGRRITNEIGGLIVAAITSIWMHAISLSGLLYTEMMWTALLYLLILVCCRIIDSKKSVNFILAGFVLGLLCLTRASTLFLLVLIPSLLLWQLGWSSLKQIVYLMITCLVVILPWQTVILVKTGEILPLSTHGPYNLYESNNDLELKSNRFQEIKLHIIKESKIRELSYYQTAKQLALEWISENPTRYIWRGIGRVTHVPVSGVRAGILRVYQNKTSHNHEAFYTITAIVVVIAAMLGIMFSTRIRYRSIIWTMLFGTVLPLFVSVSYVRHTIPSLAVALLFSSAIFQRKEGLLKSISITGLLVVLFWVSGIIAWEIIGHR